MSEFPNRITGTEMEWGIVVPDDDSDYNARQLTQAEVDPFVEAYLHKSETPFVGTPNSCFLGNGARFYNDVGHKEYATPEDSSYLGTTANEIAGERIMYAIAEKLGKKYPKLSLNKRVVDDHGNGWGYHESYSVDATIAINAPSLALHGIHIATRNIFFGTGALLTNGEFVIAQKATTLDTDYHGITTSVKPVVNLRDNDHLADTKRFHRVHVTSGDPNMSPWATQMKLGTTSLVLRLIENRQVLPHLRINDLLAATQTIATDTQLRKGLELRSGSTKTALQIQQELCTAACNLSRVVELSQQDLWTISEWQRACSDMAQDPRLLYDRADWVLKKRLLDKKQTETNLEWTSDKMQAYEKSFNEVGPDTLSARWREGLWKQWMPEENLIEQRLSHSPRYTRARIRGDFIHAVAGTNNKADKKQRSTSWEHIQHDGVRVPLTNPYERSNECAEELIRKVA